MGGVGLLPRGRKGVSGPMLGKRNGNEVEKGESSNSGTTIFGGKRAERNRSYTCMAFTGSTGIAGILPEQRKHDHLYSGIWGKVGRLGLIRTYTSVYTSPY